MSNSQEYLKVLIERFLTSPEFGTFGLVYLIKPNGTKELLGVSLECYHNKGKNLPYYDCIPEGTYEVSWELSPRFKRYTYRLKSVLNRSGILFHPANYAAYTPKFPTGKCDLLGCIALGEKIEYYKGSIVPRAYPTLMLSNSGKVTKSFEELFNTKPFTLTITDEHLTETFDGRFIEDFNNRLG